MTGQLRERTEWPFCFCILFQLYVWNEDKLLCQEAKTEHFQQNHENTGVKCAALWTPIK